MHPEAYEHHVADVLREEGWTATVTPMGGDWGLDVVAERQGRRLGVQVKRYGGSTRKVNREEIMCLRGAADYQDSAYRVRSK